ncbi:sigma-E factor regulatory protein RseB domain-containing protein [Bacillus sp. FJAT-29814]|uniref:LolA family protein n=1 Tax=Bacillus sp. FJAT-29814 TaxID=1729688 RepID=UPI00082ACD03|nr:sigma-E factor regulatory protein RseB domain-containing protein [Bacillus sp. FJAT-29814]
MDNIEKKVSDYIDQLNAERKPDEHEAPAHSEEMEQLFQTVRMVRSLKEPAMPEGDFSKKLAQADKAKEPQKKQRTRTKWTWAAAVASIAAVFVLAMNFLPFGETNIVNAMEEAYRQLDGYHGTLEMVETNADGTSAVQGKWEVWADKDGHYVTKGLEGSQKDVTTANNGEKKWQIRPSEKQVHVFPAFPDTYRFTFELGTEIQAVKNALSTKVVGESTIADRKTTVVEVTPKGGSPYQIWIDNETKLPLQKQTPMHNGIQYKVTYTKMEAAKSIPEELTAYDVPAGFKEINTNPEQIVSSLEEAAKAVGFMPVAPTTLPSGYVLAKVAIIPNKNLVKTYYSANNNHVVLLQGKDLSEFKLASTAILGKINGNPAEIQDPVQEDSGILSGGGAYAGETNLASIRWQQDGSQYAVVGDIPVTELAGFINAFFDANLEIPSLDQSHPQVKVPYDLAVEENDQKSVDAGSSPWKLDPAFVAQVFVSLKISPEGITGDYPIKTEELKVVQNNGKDAIIEVSSPLSPIKRVYLQRLVRQDSTGIWTVVGYDSADQ